MYTVPCGYLIDKSGDKHHSVNYIYIMIRKSDYYVRYYVEDEAECCEYDSGYDMIYGDEPMSACWLDSIDLELQTLID